MKRPTRRGEYEYPVSSGEEPSSVIFGRRYFLEAAVRLEPDVLLSLKEVEKRHHSVAKELSPTELRDYLTNLATPTERHARYFRAVDRWAKRWHLDVDWCRRYALVSLWSWSIGDPPEWCFHDDGAWEPTSETPKPRWPDMRAWNPVRETRGEYLRDALSIASTALNFYCDQIELAAKAAGLEATVEKRKPLHFYWLAGYQTRGWSRQRIADAENKERRTVETAVADLGRTIGLTLRPVEDYDRSQTVEKIRRALDAANDPATLLERFE